MVCGCVGIGAAALSIVGMKFLVRGGGADMGRFIAQYSCGNFDHPSLHKGGFPFEDVLLLEQAFLGGGGGKSRSALSYYTLGDIGGVCIVVVELDEPIPVPLGWAGSISWV